MMGNKTGVLFVCLGNICRSPMAEAVFRNMIRSENLEDRFHIDSAGTSSWHIGKPPHHGTRRLLDDKQISYDGLKARQVSEDDFSTFDYIVAMDNQNEADLKLMARNGEGHIIKLLDFLPDVSDKNIPDPYYTGNFEEVYALVDKGCRALLDSIIMDDSV